MAFPKSLLRLAIQDDHKDDCAWMPLAVSSNMKSSASVRGTVVKVADQGGCKAHCRLFSCPDRIIGKNRWMQTNQRADAGWRLIPLGGSPRRSRRAGPSSEGRSRRPSKQVCATLSSCKRADGSQHCSSSCDSSSGCECGHADCTAKPQSGTFTSE